MRTIAGSIDSRDNEIDRLRKACEHKDQAIKEVQADRDEWKRRATAAEAQAAGLASHPLFAFMAPNAVADSLRKDLRAVREDLDEQRACNERQCVVIREQMAELLRQRDELLGLRHRPMVDRSQADGSRAGFDRFPWRGTMVFREARTVVVKKGEDNHVHRNVDSVEVTC